MRHDEPASGVPTEPDPLASLDPQGIGRAAMAVWNAMLTSPQSVLSAQVELAASWSDVVTRTLGDAVAGVATAPVVTPAPSDNRWKHPAWRDNPVFDALKQSYLLTCRAMLQSIDDAEGVDPATKARVKFFAKQFCDAMSPTNIAFLNPAVIEETFRSGGKNLERGVHNVLEDAVHNNARPALVDKSAFEVGKNVATSPGSVVFRNELIEVIQYAPSTSQVFARPLLIVPPWINKFYILDLQPANSFIKYATDNGIQTFVVSWRNPDASLSHLGFADYLKLGPLAAGAAVREITASPDLNQIGYCIGGTLTSMELAYLAKTDPGLVNAVTFFAALTDFSEAGEIKNFLSPESVAFLEQEMGTRGVFDADKMADAFSMLRANDLIWNVAINRYLLGKPAPAFDLLYWNADATAMPAAMHSYYLKNMYLRNALAKGELDVDGVPIDLGSVRNDVFAVASIEDHIAPWSSVYKMTGLFGGDVRFRLGHSGHIAGIVNPPGAGKGNFWRNDHTPPQASEWFAGAERVAGSWWPEWLAWIGERSGERVAAPAALGSAAHPPLEAAPGSYVFT